MAEERVQRRLAAIVVADVVGYSRLMEEDEVATLAVLKERRATSPALRRRLSHGRIARMNAKAQFVDIAVRSLERARAAATAP